MSQAASHGISNAATSGCGCPMSLARAVPWRRFCNPQVVFGADTPRPATSDPYDRDEAARRARLLLEHYPSQPSHDWFREQPFVQRSRSACVGRSQRMFFGIRRQGDGGRPIARAPSCFD
jgi:hypothetical protein